MFKDCSGAIDGVIAASTSYRWAFRGSPINSWIQVTFQRSYSISMAKITPLLSDIERTFKMVQFKFSTQLSMGEPFVDDGLPVEVSMERIELIECEI